MTSRHSNSRTPAPDWKRLAWWAALGTGAAIVGSLVLSFLLLMWAAVFTVIFG